MPSGTSLDGNRPVLELQRLLGEMSGSSVPLAARVWTRKRTLLRASVPVLMV